MLSKSCPQAIVSFAPEANDQLFFLIKKVGKKIIGKHPRLPTNGLIATTKESFDLFASYCSGLRTFKFIHFYGSQAAFVATAIFAKWVPVSGCKCREDEDAEFEVTMVFFLGIVRILILRAADRRRSNLYWLFEKLMIVHLFGIPVALLQFLFFSKSYHFFV